MLIGKDIGSDDGNMKVSIVCLNEQHVLRMRKRVAVLWMEYCCR